MVWAGSPLVQRCLRDCVCCTAAGALRKLMQCCRCQDKDAWIGPAEKQPPVSCRLVWCKLCCCQLEHNAQVNVKVLLLAAAAAAAVLLIALVALDP